MEQTVKKALVVQSPSKFILVISFRNANPSSANKSTKRNNHRRRLVYNSWKNFMKSTWKSQYVHNASWSEKNCLAPWIDRAEWLQGKWLKRSSLLLWEENKYREESISSTYFHTYLFTYNIFNISSTHNKSETEEPRTVTVTAVTAAGKASRLDEGKSAPSNSCGYDC